jgi:hypothetical protein
MKIRKKSYIEETEKNTMELNSRVNLVQTFQVKMRKI